MSLVMGQERVSFFGSGQGAGEETRDSASECPLLSGASPKARHPPRPDWEAGGCGAGSRPYARLPCLTSGLSFQWALLGTVGGRAREVISGAYVGGLPVPSLPRPLQQGPGPSPTRSAEAPFP